MRRTSPPPDAALPVYRNARLGEVTGGVLTCAAPVFAPSRPAPPWSRPPPVRTT